jgi:hypothetical protein
LEQRAPVGAGELDELMEGALDLLVDAFHRQAHEAGREVAQETLGAAALAVRGHAEG